MTAPEGRPPASVRALRPSHQPGTLVLVLGGPIGRAGIPGLCECVQALLESGTEDLVICDVGALFDPDVATVDALARLQLIARRFGRRVRFLDACGELQDLVALMGLDDVLLPVSGSPGEPRGQAEQREQPLGVQEEADPGDPAG